MQASNIEARTNPSKHVRFKIAPGRIRLLLGKAVAPTFSTSSGESFPSSEGDMKKITKPLLWLGAIAALLLFYMLSAPSFQRNGTDAAQDHSFRLSIDGPVAPGLAPAFKATQGDRLTFVIRSKQPGSVHVHGYEKMVRLFPGREVQITFVADRAGYFALHLHDPDEVMHAVASLEVTPR